MTENIMTTLGKTRKFNKKTYELASNPHGISSDEVNTIKTSFLKRRYKVRVIWNGNYPYIYPEGRYFVYVRKPSATTISVNIKKT